MRQLGEVGHGKWSKFYWIFYYSDGFFCCFYYSKTHGFAWESGEGSNLEVISCWYGYKCSDFYILPMSYSTCFLWCSPRLFANSSIDLIMLPLWIWHYQCLSGCKWCSLNIVQICQIMDQGRECEHNQSFMHGASSLCLSDLSLRLSWIIS